MIKKSLTTVLSLVLTFSLHSQTYTVNQQSQQVNINVPVIEKPVYIEKYRTVYVNKPRVARKLEKPVLLLGYLWVYPEDLGNFGKIPAGVINSINVQRPYGRNNWRIPTPDELAVLEANAEKIGLGDDIYLATDHCNGVLRLVAVDDSYNDCVWIGGAYWSKHDLGSSSMYTSGRLVTYEEAVKFCPEGWRLPTVDDFNKLRNSGKVSFEGLSSEGELHFPSRPYSGENSYGSEGKYWLKEENGSKNGFYFYHKKSRWHTGGVYPEYEDLDNDHPRYSDEERCVRYIKE